MTEFLMPYMSKKRKTFNTFALEMYYNRVYAYINYSN